MGRCLVVSLSTTLLSAIVLVALAVGATVHAGTANVIAVVCGIGPSYVGNRRFVWRRSGRGRFSREVAPFWLLSLAGLLASTIAVSYVDHWLRSAQSSQRAVALPLANLSAFGLLWLVQFFVCDRVIFRTRPADAGTKVGVFS